MLPPGTGVACFYAFLDLTTPLLSHADDLAALHNLASRSDVSGSCASGSEAPPRDWMLSRQSSALLSDGKSQFQRYPLSLNPESGFREFCS